MTEYLSEKEQWEEIRTWVRENGLWAVAGVALVVVGWQGWHWWQGHLDERGIRAGAAYTRMIDALEKGDRSQAFVRLGELERDYPASPYADQAELLAARLYVESNELDKAAHQLETLMNRSKDHDLALVARMRLARVEIAQAKPDAAIATLDATEPGAFAARYHEVRGDALYAKGDRPAALKEYRSAAGSPDLGDAALLDLKIADLAGDAPPASAAPAPAAGAPAPGAAAK